MKVEDDTLSVVGSLFGILAGSELAGMTDDEIKGVILEGRSKCDDRVD